MVDGSVRQHLSIRVQIDPTGPPAPLRAIWRVSSPVEDYIGLEYDLRAEGAYTLRLTSSNVNAAASIHVVLTRTQPALRCRQYHPVPADAPRRERLDRHRAGRWIPIQFAVQAGDLVSFRLLRGSPAQVCPTSTPSSFSPSMRTDDP